MECLTHFVAKALLFVVVSSSSRSSLSHHSPCLQCWSLSLDDSFLSSASPNQRQRLQQLKDNELTIPGIWKLTTDSLPYELDIRSKLDKRFSNENNSNYNNKNNNHSHNRDRNDKGGETILLKLNQDGTFKQYDEGYREGRWVTGRWKLRVLESPAETSTSTTTTTTSNEETKINTMANDDSSNRETLSWLLLLAMNRQYFGPPYDVLLEATTNTMTAFKSGINNSTVTAAMATSTNGTTTSRGRETGEQEPSSSSSSLKHWQGVVKKGKFIRPSPGKHPLDLHSSGQSTNRTTSATVTTTGILMNPESLGIFSLEQALAANSIGRRKRWNNDEIGADNCDSLRTGTGANGNDSDLLEDGTGFSTEEDIDETFFSPRSPSDDGGVLQ